MAAYPSRRLCCLGPLVAHVSPLLIVKAICSRVLSAGHGGPLLAPSPLAARGEMGWPWWSSMVAYPLPTHGLHWPRVTPAGHTSTARAEEDCLQLMLLAAACCWPHLVLLDAARCQPQPVLLAAANDRPQPAAGRNLCCWPQPVLLAAARCQTQPASGRLSRLHLPCVDPLAWLLA
ncbi:hypothetical protein Dimus_029031, partial [Dionaea muscipula]